MTTPTFIPGIGRLALDRYDFRDHVDGYASKHNANAITVIPSLTLNSTTITDVYSALTQIGVELGFLELSGKGFITVGDGFDTYHKSNPEDPDYDPDAPYDSAILAFDSYLDDLLNITDPLDVDYNPLHARIRSGGLVLIKAGTYKFTGTVNVPPGIILIGEGYGTKIVNQIVSAAPLFIIKADASRTADTGIDSINTFMFAKESGFINLVVADNFLEPKFLGDLTYKDPNNDDDINPLISVEEGASFTCDNVKLVGKTTYSLGIVTDLTSFAIKLNNTIPVTTGTYLRVKNCIIDGFSIPISFDSSAGRNDYLEVSNCKIRAHGYLTGDGVAAQNNCVIHMNDNNAVITNNDFYGNHDALTTLCFVKNVIASPPAAGDLSSIVIASNEMVVGKGDVVSISADPIIIDAGIASTFNQYAYILAHGNLCAAGFSVTTTSNAATQLYVDSSNIVVGSATNVTVESTAASIALGGGLITSTGGHREARSITLNQTTCPGGTYVVDVDGAQTDYIMLFPNNSNFVTIGQVAVTMPPATVGRILIFKEIQNDGSASNTLTCAGTDLIEDIGGTGYIASTIFATAGLTITYIGVFDPQTALNRWSILSAWSVNVLL